MRLKTSSNCAGFDFIDFLSPGNDHRFLARVLFDIVNSGEYAKHRVMNDERAIRQLMQHSSCRLWLDIFDEENTQAATLKHINP